MGKTRAKRGPRYIGMVNPWSTLENVVMPKGAAASRAAATAIAANSGNESKSSPTMRQLTILCLPCTSTLFYFQCKFLHKPHSPLVQCSFPDSPKRSSRLGHASPRRAWTNPVIAEMTPCRPEALTRDSMSHTDASLTLIEFFLPNYSISNRPER